jgi:Kef-type K+ transport system membrane component KefB/nucleotide-binding universal stress UspA family protein
MNIALLIIALLGAAALLTSKLFKRFVPEIVVFLALGVLIGPEGPWDLINEQNIRSLELITQVGLGAIIFLIGDRLRLDQLKGSGRLLVPLNLAQLAASSTLVFLATRWAGADLRVALLLALIAAETGVLTVTATMTEERAKGPYTDQLLSCVGITNVATAALFGVAFPFVLAASGEAEGLLATAQVFAQVVVASTAIGLLGGWVLRTFAKAIESSGELLLFLLIVLTAIVGGAIAVDGSVVVAALIAGLYVANLAPWLADRFFAAVRTLQAPIYLVFFVVAGASIHLDELASVGLVGAAYVIARSVGKLAGATLGAVIGKGARAAPNGFATGIGLLPHAGMAIALVAFVVEQSPRLGPEVSAVVLGSIVLFELAGPLLIRGVLRRVDEAGKARSGGVTELLADLHTHTSFEKVLVPVGNVEVILPRLGFLLDLVVTMGAELVAVHISRPGSGLSEDEEPEILALVRELAEERNLPCTTVHRVSEQIASTLVDVAKHHDVDLVIMGQPVRARLQPARWGLVSQRVVRDLEAPVLVYPVDPNDVERVPDVYLRRALRASVADAEAGNLPAREPRVAEPTGPLFRRPGQG